MASAWPASDRARPVSDARPRHALPRSSSQSDVMPTAMAAASERVGMLRLAKTAKTRSATELAET
eukprot:scaffold136017_cov30-Tisochrysis_lutea.AAC.1